MHLQGRGWMEPLLPPSPGWFCASCFTADAAPKHFPLHGLENCLRDLVSEGRSGSSNGDVPKPEMWAPQEGKAEGVCHRTPRCRGWGDPE